MKKILLIISISAFHIGKAQVEIHFQLIGTAVYLLDSNGSGEAPEDVDDVIRVNAKTEQMLIINNTVHESHMYKATNFRYVDGGALGQDLLFDIVDLATGSKSFCSADWSKGLSVLILYPCDDSQKRLVFMVSKYSEL